MKAHFDMMAAYNRWANARLYDACAELSDEDLRAGLGVFFGTLHATLNHMLVADRIWMARFTGERAAPTDLDAILHEDFDGLRAARRAEDDRIVDWTAGLDEDALAATFSYTRIVDPEPITQPLAPALAHFFNHQTHHRGQCHAMLTRLTADAPSFDLVAFQRESGVGMAA